MEEIIDESVNTGKLPDRIIKFIGEHHLLTLAVSDESDIWCSHAFYVFIEEERAFLITSEDKTRHIQLAQKKDIVAGGIALETDKIGEIRGLQFKAVIDKCDDSLLGPYKMRYLKRFPYAILKGGDLWRLTITEAKLTDNRLGFGKKIKWSR
jgi:uncharacterized protein YhbP (UPF0306 family)